MLFFKLIFFYMSMARTEDKRSDSMSQGRRGRVLGRKETQRDEIAKYTPD